MEQKQKDNDFHQYESYQPHLQPVHGAKGARQTRINNWLSKHRWPVLAATVLVVISIFAAFYYKVSRLQFGTEFATNAIRSDKKFYSPLTGAEVSEEQSKRAVIAAMVENSPDARPQSGLKDAGVVFESVAEGGITRFLLLYQEGEPSLVGPVRSVRPQFASWAAAFDAGLAHVGGSDIPLQKLRSGKIKDLDQFFNAGAYYRASDRAAPHNVYTSMERLRKIADTKGYTASNFTPWKRDEKSKPAKTPTATKINVPVSTGLFAVSYTWDSASNSYQRMLAGAPHKDREEGQLAPKVVIAMQVPHDVIKDSNRYTYPDVNTSGKAWVFQNGLVGEVTWSKADDASQIKFVDQEGKAVKLAPGQTWITAIRPESTPSWQ